MYIYIYIYIYIHPVYTYRCLYIYIRRPCGGVVSYAKHRYPLSLFPLIRRHFFEKQEPFPNLFQTFSGTTPEPIPDL